MKKNLVISSVAAFAALNPEGFTVNAANLQPVTTTQQKKPRSLLIV